jgi:hypothetical protein
VGFFENVPFKRVAMIKDHAKFVNCARFAPDGSVFVTADAGGKTFIYDGIAGTLKGELNGGEASAHKVGNFCCTSTRSPPMLGTHSLLYTHTVIPAANHPYISSIGLIFLNNHIHSPPHPSQQTIHPSIHLIHVKNRAHPPNHLLTHSPPAHVGLPAPSPPRVAFTGSRGLPTRSSC